MSYGDAFYMKDGVEISLEEYKESIKERKVREAYARLKDLGIEINEVNNEPTSND